MEDPEVELDTALPFRDRPEPIEAIGAETLLACVDSGNGTARVTAALDPFAEVSGGVNGTSNGNGGAGGGLNLAVAGEMRTGMNGKGSSSYVNKKLTWSRKTIEAMHLDERSLLITLVSEATEDLISTSTEETIDTFETNRTNP
jgi:hypothetical protein